MPRALWLAETTSKALVSRSPARGHEPEPAGRSAPSAFSMKPLIIIFPPAKFPRKISGDSLQRGPQQSTGKLGKLFCTAERGHNDKNEESFRPAGHAEGDWEIH
jgi:hypothetical protein